MIWVKKKLCGKPGGQFGYWYIKYILFIEGLNL